MLSILSFQRIVKDVQELIFPKTIPQPRGNKAEYATAIFSAVIILVGCIFNSDKLLYILTTISLFVVGKFVVELLFRIVLICEERYHIKSRYNGSFLTLLIDAFTFSTCSKCLSVLSLISLLCLSFKYGNPVMLLYNFGTSSNACAYIGMCLASKLFELDYGPLYQSVLMTKLKGLDYGSAMAYSYFHGYLQIVLPYKGTEQKGIKELMRDFESTEGIKFELHKLLILIPLSLYSPNNLENCSNIVEQSKSLPEITLTRSGVRDRIYKNTVYKIKNKYYVCAEYVTLLQTFHDVVSHNNIYANCYKKHSKELVLQFYLTLRNILHDNPDCGNYCELLFFDDKDSRGNRVDIGEVILNHLKHKKSAEKKRNTEKND